jgi:hypothetical protein
MIEFIKIYNKDKRYVKMINSTNNGFILAFLSSDVLEEFKILLENSNKNNREIYLIWNMKFKKDNFILYKNCKFDFNSVLLDNSIDVYSYVKVTCSDTSFYKEKLKNNYKTKTNIVYKDINLLNRLIKINELNLTNY